MGSRARQRAPARAATNARAAPAPRRARHAQAGHSSARSPRPTDAARTLRFTTRKLNDPIDAAARPGHHEDGASRRPHEQIERRIVAAGQPQRFGAPAPARGSPSPARCHDKGRSRTPSEHTRAAQRPVSASRRPRRAPDLRSELSNPGSRSPSDHRPAAISCASRAAREAEPICNDTARYRCLGAAAHGCESQLRAGEDCRCSSEGRGWLYLASGPPKPLAPWRSPAPGFRRRRIRVCRDAARVERPHSV